MATESGKMSQHRLQGANPRGFEGSAGLPDGKHTLDLGVRGAPGLGGGRAVSLKVLYLESFKLKDLKDLSLKLKK